MYARSVTAGPIAAASANNIATSQTPGAAGNLMLNGSTASGGVATLDVARRVLLTFGADSSARTFVIYGTNGSGNAIKETLAGAAATSQTLQDFLTVTRISIDGAAPGTITAGTSGVASSPWMALNPDVTPTWVNFDALTSGTVNYDVQLTVDNLNPVGIIPWSVPNAQSPIAALTGKTGAAQGSTGGLPYSAWRVTLNSGSGSVTVTALEAGITF